MGKEIPSSGTPQKPVPVAAGRVPAIDQLRGLVMVLMVLDHALFYFTDPGVNPVDLTATTPGLFMAEWVTHFCAPVFFLLAGVGAFLQVARGTSKRELAKYLFIRGLLLVLLDMTVVQWALYFRFDFSMWETLSNGTVQRIILFTPLVLWGLGLSMLVMAAMIWLPTPAVGLIGVGIILFHNLLDPINAAYTQAYLNGQAVPWPWLLLHQRGEWIVSDHSLILVNFPLLPWLGVMAAGYGLGPLFLQERSRRRTTLLRLGCVLSAAFFVLRIFNLYGDPVPWEPQADNAFSWLSFLNCEKYPASLQFLLMTLGPALLVLAALDREPAANGNDGKERFGDRLLQPFKLFGRVPLFFYLGQWYMLHFLALALAWWQGRPTDWLFQTLDFNARPVRFANWDNPAADVGLGYAYGAWILSVLLLYPLCVWFARLKERHRDSWLRYL